MEAGREAGVGFFFGLCLWMQAKVTFVCMSALPGCYEVTFGLYLENVKEEEGVEWEGR